MVVVAPASGWHCPRSLLLGYEGYEAHVSFLWHFWRHRRLYRGATRVADIHAKGTLFPAGCHASPFGRRRLIRDELNQPAADAPAWPWIECDAKGSEHHQCPSLVWLELTDRRWTLTDRCIDGLISRR